jgi:adenylate cyclase
MSQALDGLNRALADDVASGLKIGIGIHLGPAIVGEMGYGGATGLTAIGDTVNTASRLESMAKDFGAELVLSEAVEKAAGIDLPDLAQHAVKIRGRAESILIRAAPLIAELPDPAADPRQSIAASAR